MIAMELKIMARTNDPKILAKFPHQQIYRWGYGAQLPHDRNGHFWNVPDCLKDAPLYLGVSYPVKDDLVVRVVGRHGNDSWVEDGGLGGPGTKTAFIKWVGLVYQLDTTERTLSVREVRIMSQDGKAILKSEKLFRETACLSPAGKLAPTDFGLPTDSFFWDDLVDACNRFNLFAGYTRSGGTLIHMGVVSQR